MSFNQLLKHLSDTNSTLRDLRRKYGKDYYRCDDQSVRDGLVALDYTVPRVGKAVHEMFKRSAEKSAPSGTPEEEGDLRGREGEE